MRAALDALDGAIARALRAASRQVETMTLAGLTAADLADAGQVPPAVGYAAVRAVLVAALAELDALDRHAHVWDYGDRETDPVRCALCGADGLA
jgi:hypothetical protein